MLSPVIGIAAHVAAARAVAVQRLRTCRGCRGVEPGLADLAIAVVVALDGERYPDECDAREDGEKMIRPRVDIRSTRREIHLSLYAQKFLV